MGSGYGVGKEEGGARRPRTPAKVVQEQLGHASIGVTMNTYSRVVPAMMQAAPNAMDRALATPR